MTSLKRTAPARDLRNGVIEAAVTLRTRFAVVVRVPRGGVLVIAYEPLAGERTNVGGRTEGR